MTDEGYACRFCVDGVEATQLIIAYLSHSFAFQTSEPIRVGANPSQRIFRVAYGSQMDQRDLVRLMSGIAGLRLRVTLAAESKSARKTKRST